MMIDLNSPFWAGTEAALASYLAGMGMSISADQQVEQEVPRLLSVQGDIGVISIAGPLVPGDSWINAFVGRTGYGEIREAVIHAASDPAIKAIVLDINSGGGAVAGADDTSALIRSVDKKSKPVYAYTDSVMASAAYWLGSAAREVHAGKTAEVGSIGILQIHKEFSKALEMEGVKATVIKAGEHKGQGNPYEPLSASAKEQMQAQVDHVYDMFVDTVATNRGVSAAEVDSKMAQGRVFIGSQAKDVGLVDSISNFDAVISRVQGTIDKQKSRSQYGSQLLKGPSAMKVALTEQQLAAMAEGGMVAQAAASTTAPEAQAPAAEAASAPAAAAPAAQETPAPAAAEASSDLVAFLKDSLAQAQASVASLTIELRDAQASLKATTATQAALRQIAQDSVDRLKVALGGTGGVAAQSDELLLAEHATLRAQFESKYKAGGVAAVSSTGSSESQAVTSLDPVRQARLASTRVAK